MVTATATVMYVADSPMSKTGKRVAKKKRRVQEISSDEEEAVLSGNI